MNYKNNDCEVIQHVCILLPDIAQLPTQHTTCKLITI